jgi:hypothetical protein
MFRIAACVVVFLGLFAGVGNAQIIPGWDPNWVNLGVSNIEISNLLGTYTAADGHLTVAPKSGGPAVTVHWDNGAGPDWTLQGSSAIAEAIGKLYLDNSGVPPLAPGQAEGWFNGNGVQLPGDATADWRMGWDFGLGIKLYILSGSLDVYRAREIFNTGQIEGSGRVTANGGLLVALHIWPDMQTSLSSFTFMVKDPSGKPLNVSNFSQSFSGDMFMTFWPDADHGIPEPATLVLLGGGMAIAALRRRR